MHTRAHELWHKRISTNNHMAFTEVLKIKIRKRAHFMCCVCKAIGIEVHHIIPQEENGPDMEDNAAPLCPTCHETYGANPQKRKFIREARDHWYEICDKRFNSDPKLLEEIKQLISNAISREDLHAFKKEVISLLQPPPKKLERDTQPAFREPLLRSLSPHLRIIAPPSQRFNSVAWAASDNQTWWWPAPASLKYFWPSNVPRTETVDAFISAFKTLGYQVCPDASAEAGFEKVAIHTTETGLPCHVARQLTNGKWTSKLGALELVEYNDVDILIPLYGRIALFMKRVFQDTGFSSPEFR
jgi:hypothetical protein